MIQIRTGQGFKGIKEPFRREHADRIQMSLTAHKRCFGFALLDIIIALLRFKIKKNRLIAFNLNIIICINIFFVFARKKTKQKFFKS